MEQLNKLAVQNFREYLRIDTMHPNPDYSKAVEFLHKQAVELKLEFHSMEIFPQNPIVIMKWNGRNSNLKSVVLNSHMDVVPVFPDEWKYPPFSAHIDENGNIYARGSQDMKCVGSQYLEAVRRIQNLLPLYTPERDIYILFVPDEELGGQRGMKIFVENDYFTRMNVGIMMDEGIASSNEDYYAFYNQRNGWYLKVVITGNDGLGWQLVKNSAGEKMRFILNKFTNYRQLEETRMLENNLSLGDVTTINLTGISGGVQHNVVPSSFTLTFDIRATPKVDIIDLQNMFDDWGIEAGGGIQYETIAQTPVAPPTDISKHNPWWVAFQSACNSLEMSVSPMIFPACTDCRFARNKNISAVGFSPMNRTPVLLHDHNEFINIEVFLRGIDFYEILIRHLAAVVE